MQDWQYAQTEASEELAEVHHFMMQKIDPGPVSDFPITVRPYTASPTGDRHHFYVEADHRSAKKLRLSCPPAGESPF